MLTLPTTGPYARKDQLKANGATKMTLRGSERSSTYRYVQANRTHANTGHYVPGDVVFVSAEGNRRGRLRPDAQELRRAADAGVTFITDPLGTGEGGTRSHPYNVGEREVAALLEGFGYADGGSGTWTREKI